MLLPEGTERKYNEKWRICVGRKRSLPRQLPFSARALLVLCIEERQREVRAGLKCTCGQMLGTSAGETGYPLPCFGIHIKGDLSRVTVAPQIGHNSSSKCEVYVIGPPGYDTNIICQDPFLGCDRPSCSCILGDLSQHGDKSPPRARASRLCVCTTRTGNKLGAEVRST